VAPVEFVTRTPRADLVRLPDWEQRLAALANSWRNKPYAYGVTDCGQFALAGIAAVTGVALLDDIVWPRGWLGVAKVMIANGWKDVEATMDDILPRGEVIDSRRGDVVSYEGNGELHLAVRFGDYSLTPGTTGLELIPSARWINTWRAG
jgi:hypothetical protein